MYGTIRVYFLILLLGMLKYIFIVLVFIVAVLLWMFFGIGVSNVSVSDIPEQLVVHTYDEPGVAFDNPTRSIENVHIYAVYFTPSDTKGSMHTDQGSISKQRPALEDALLQLTRFHELQLQNRSHLTYSIYPKAVIGRYGMAVYETPRENVAGFEAFASISETLASVAEEIEERVFLESGDLYNPSFFQKTEDNVYSVMLILYEGDDSITKQGAAADTFYNHSPEKDKEFAVFTGLPELASRTATVEAVDSGMIVNTSFLTDSLLYGVTIFAHEFYHTFNVPDGYDYHVFDPRTRINLSLTPDLMGLRRNESLDWTYLDRTILTNMGF